MILPALSIVVPVFLAFKRGHSGVAILMILLCAMAVGAALALLTKAVIVYYVIYGLSWLGCVTYCLLEDGPRGDQLQVAGEPMPDMEISKEQAIDPSDYVVLETFTDPSRLGELVQMVSLLKANGIHYKENSGIIATVTVRECDFPRAIALTRPSELVDDH